MTCIFPHYASVPLLLRSAVFAFLISRLITAVRVFLPMLQLYLFAHCEKKNECSQRTSSGNRLLCVQNVQILAMHVKPVSGKLLYVPPVIVVYVLFTDIQL